MRDFQEKKPVRALIAIFAILALLVASCGSEGTVDDPGAADGDGEDVVEEAGTDGESSEEQSEERILNVGYRTNDPDSLDPYRGTDGSSHTILWTIFDTLISFEPETLAPAPGLAHTWTWVDELTLDLDLEEGVTFHDGTDFDAEAVKFNLDRVLDEEEGVLVGSDIAAVTDVEVLDTHQIRLNLERPAASLVLALSDRAGMMVSPTAFQADPGSMEREPVGAGEYEFISWNSGDSILVEAYDDYWRERDSNLDGIRFHLMAEPETRLNALRAGDIDFTYDIAPESITLIDDDDEIEWLNQTSVAYFQLYMDLSQEPFDNLNVRRAIAMAIDREALTDAVTGGLGEPAYMPMPSDHWAYTPELAGQPAFDPDGARELLAEAGYDDGFEFDMTFETGSIHERRAEIIQSYLADLNITVNLLPADTAQASSDFLEQRIPVLNNRWTGRVDPAVSYAGMFSPSGFTNVGGYESDAVVEAIAQGDAAASQAERAAAYADLNAALIEEAFNVPLFFQPGLHAFSVDVGGFEANLITKPKFDSVSLP